MNMGHFQFEIICLTIFFLHHMSFYGSLLLLFFKCLKVQRRALLLHTSIYTLETIKQLLTMKCDKIKYIKFSYWIKKSHTHGYQFPKQDPQTISWDNRENIEKYSITLACSHLEDPPPHPTHCRPPSVTSLPLITWCASFCIIVIYLNSLSAFAYLALYCNLPSLILCWCYYPFSAELQVEKQPTLCGGQPAITLNYEMLGAKSPFSTETQLHWTTASQSP